MPIIANKGKLNIKKLQKVKKRPPQSRGGPAPESPTPSISTGLDPAAYSCIITEHFVGVNNLVAAFVSVALQITASNRTRFKTDGPQICNPSETVRGSPDSPKTPYIK
jgi:hypothetical protein